MSKPDTVTFSITLPAQANRLLIALIPDGLHGPTRAEVARALILDQLKLLKAQGLKARPGEADEAEPTE